MADQVCGDPDVVRAKRELSNERAEDAAYGKITDRQGTQGLTKEGCSLSDRDLHELFAQIGIQLIIIELKDFLKSYSEIPDGQWVIVYCPAYKPQNHEAHWLGAMNDMGYTALFDTFGRHILDIIEDHGSPPTPKRFNPDNFVTLTGDLQGDISIVCGYYLCVFADLLTVKCGGDYDQFDQALDELFIDNSNMAVSAKVALVHYFNDERCIQLFAKCFDVSQLNGAEQKQRVIQVNKIL